MQNHTVTDREARESRPPAVGIFIQRAEQIVGIVISAVALFLFVVRATHAGSLWRDEADSVQSAHLPLGEMVHTVQFSSFPILFPLLVRGYTALFHASDASLRCFGLVVGILLLVISWLPGRKVIGSVPLFLLGMIGLNANLLIAGMSLRGYGFGSFLVLLAFTRAIRFARDPNVLTLLLLSILSLLSLHCLFWNVPLVLAMTIGVSAVLLFKGKIKWVWLLAAFLIVSGLSQIPYLLQFRSSFGGWEKIIQVPVPFRLVRQYFFVAWGDISPLISTIWLILLGLAVICGLWRAATIWRGDLVGCRDSLVFGILFLPLSVLASFALALMVQRSPEQRFFLAITILAAASVDLVWTNLSHWLRLARIILVILATVNLPFMLWGYIVQSESNAETIARILERYAAPRDLIVVNPWTYGVSFNWYYHGTVHWVTVPQIEDHRIHRYDLILPKMKSASPVADVEREMETTLQSGNRVWFTGQIDVPPPGERPLQLSPAPDPKFGWSGGAYRKSWSQEIGLFLWQSVPEINLVDTGTGEAISARENFSLYQLEGWKD